MEKLWMWFPLPAILFASLVSVSGSIWLSEVQGYVPCPYCWALRIIAFVTLVSSAFGLASASTNTRRKVGFSIIVLSVIGVIIATPFVGSSENPGVEESICVEECEEIPVVLGLSTYEWALITNLFIFASAVVLLLQIKHLQGVLDNVQGVEG